MIVVVLTIFTGGALLFWLGAGYLSVTAVAPKIGGQYIEGSVAQPRYVNPILSQTSEADADLVALLYAGLFGFDSQGKLEPRVASDYTLSNDGKLYTVFLKTGVRFHDAEELTADDVVFTARAIQDPLYKSPLRANWQGIEVNALDRYTVTFALKKPYFGFLENLTVGILPKHLWEVIPPDRFTLAEANLIDPIGAGPYRYASIDKDADGNILSYQVRAWGEYYAGEPYISRIIFRFYPDEVSLVEAFNRGEVMGIHSVSPENVPRLSEKKHPQVYSFGMPRAFDLFLNTNKSIPLAYDEVREALALSVDRKRIVDTVLDGYGFPIGGPFLPIMFGYDAESDNQTFDLDRANRLLDERGWVRGGDGIRAKNGVVLAFEIDTPDWPDLMQTADLLRDGWAAIGARVEVKTLSQVDLQQNVIRPRDYEALLFGQASMLNPDPYSFWHSTQKIDPGLNLAYFEDGRADELLLSARETLDEGKRAELFKEFQTIVKREHPAIFLYSPHYLYVVSSSVRGIDKERVNIPAGRLSGVARWYVKTKRVWQFESLGKIF